jgi:hypothetical protein
MEQYSEAIPVLERLSPLQKARLPGGLGSDIQLSVCQWLVGNPDHAIDIMRSLVIGTQDKSIKYASDLAGGVTQGLLLRYMAITGRFDEQYQLAVAYLTRLAQAQKADNWSGPAARFAVGMATAGEMLSAGIGVSDIEPARKIASHDLLKRRRLTNIAFNIAVNQRVEGN